MSPGGIWGFPGLPNGFGKTYRRNTANHPIRFRGSLRAQSVLVALQRLVMASTSNHRIVGGTLHDPDSAPPSVALAVRLNCQQGQTRLGAKTSFSVIQQSTRSHAPLVKLALFTRSQHRRSVSSSWPQLSWEIQKSHLGFRITVNSPKSKPRKDSAVGPAEFEVFPGNPSPSVESPYFLLRCRHSFRCESCQRLLTPRFTAAAEPSPRFRFPRWTSQT